VDFSLSQTAIYCNLSHKRLLLATSIAALAMAQPVARPVKLRCDALQNPLGIDAARPSLSWRIESPAHDAKQSAFEVIVKSGGANVWTSGKIESPAESVDYGGPPLESGRRYSWKVRVWNQAGHPATSTEPAWWEMGLLTPSDWKAQWIAWLDEEDPADRAAGVKGIWYPGGKFEPNRKLTRYFRYVLNSTSGARSATLLATAHETFRVGQFEKRKYWRGLQRFDIELKPGENVIVIEATSDGTNGGFAALVKLGVTNLPSDTRWQAATTASGPWQLRSCLPMRPIRGSGPCGRRVPPRCSRKRSVSPNRSGPPACAPRRSEATE
jgi:alpha-L-rhamnosidase